MSKYLFLAFIIYYLLLSERSQSQIPVSGINQTDGQGKKLGYWIEKEKDHTSEGKYRESLKEGTWVIYNTRGMIVQIESYTKNLKDGPFMYFENGNINKLEQYKENILQGTSKTFYFGGRPKTEEFYENGILNGAYKKFYDTPVPIRYIST